MGAVVSFLVGALIAVGAGFGLVGAATSAPAPVDAPYIVYGSS